MVASGQPGYPAPVRAWGSALAIPAAALAFVLVVTGAGPGGDPLVSVTPVLRLKAPYSETAFPPRLMPPAPVAMSWRRAGAFVWHTSHLDPVSLGAQMRRARFGWLAVFLADGAGESAVDRDWIVRFRAASGLRVGGWSVLREAPEADARRAARLVASHRLDFYVANAEREYEYTNDSVWSPERYERSRRFVTAFRRAKPSLPAALSSYCRPDRQDIDWDAWAGGGFAFLPQAYVNDFGEHAAPALCVASAEPFFPRRAVHPVVGSYGGAYGVVSPRRYAGLLARARTTGFSIYLAENTMTGASWRAYGEEIGTRGLASL